MNITQLTPIEQLRRLADRKQAFITGGSHGEDLYASFERECMRTDFCIILAYVETLEKQRDELQKDGE